MNLIGSYFEEIKLPERSRDFDLIAFQTIVRTLESRVNFVRRHLWQAHPEHFSEVSDHMPLEEFNRKGVFWYDTSNKSILEEE